MCCNPLGSCSTEIWLRIPAGGIAFYCIALLPIFFLKCWIALSLSHTSPPKISPYLLLLIPAPPSPPSFSQASPAPISSQPPPSSPPSAPPPPAPPPRRPRPRQRSSGSKPRCGRCRRRRAVPTPQTHSSAGCIFTPPALPLRRQRGSQRRPPPFRRRAPRSHRHRFHPTSPMPPLHVSNSSR